MRRDVKIGITLSLGVVMVAGWYYLRRDAEGEPLPMGVELASSSPAGQDQPSESVAAEGRAEPPPGRIQRSRQATPVKEPLPGAPAGQVSSAKTAPDTTVSPAQRPGDSEPSPAVETSPATGAPGGRGVRRRHAVGDMPSATGSLKDLLQLGRDTTGAREAGEGDAPVGMPASPQAKADPATSRASESKVRRQPRRAPGGRPAPAATAPPEQLTGPRQRTTAPPAGRTHRVERGDTFSILAESYYGSQRHTGFLIQANPQVKDPNRLLVGTALNVPALRQSREPRRTTPAAPVRKGTYLVKEGDSFYAIARDVLGEAGRWPELVALNRDLVGGDPQNLRPGQVLRLPAAKTSTGR